MMSAVRPTWNLEKRSVHATVVRVSRWVSENSIKNVASIVLIGCIASALVSPIIAYDNWYYHLPFSARLWNIAGGADTFRFDSHLEARWRGFPLLWDWLQGLMWYFTGSIRTLIVPQLILCLLYFVVASRALMVPWYWLVLGFFSSPMLLIHFHALYADLPAGLCLTIGFLLLMRHIHAPRVNLATSITTIAALGMAGNIKVQALMSAVIVGFAVIAVALIKLGWQTKTARIAAIALVGVFVSSATALSNIERTGNPLYPFNVEAAGTTFFVGPENPMKGAMRPDYQGRGGISVPPTPLAFALSATELDWTLRGIPAWYSIDSRAGDRPLVGGPSRTGGWGWLFVFVNGFLLLLQTISLRKARDPLQRSLVVGTIIVILATAFLPRSHELRYWLLVPLIMLPVNLRYIEDAVSRRFAAGGLVAAMLYGTAQALLTPGTQLLTERLSFSKLDRPPHIASKLQEQGRYCSDDTLLFRYSAAITGSPGLLSLRVEDCALGSPEQLPPRH